MATASQGKKRPDLNESNSGVRDPKLWATANALRGNIDAAEYKHVVLPLMFLKYISDAFEELHEELESKVDEGRDPEQPDEYKERNVFWVPQDARWSIIQSRARQEDIGATIDRAMDVIERDNELPEGSSPQKFRQRQPGQTGAGPGCRPSQQHQGRRHPGPGDRCAGAGLRVLSWNSSP